MGLIRCDGCQGRKRKLGMGGMIMKCDECNGIGWIEPPKDNDINFDSLVNAKGEPVKGRHKKEREANVNE